MDNYVTGSTVRSLRENKGMTQDELAARIHVSAKAVSKWETGKGFPDVRLLSGCVVHNRNKAANMLRGRLYVCPVCGNIIQASGEAVVSCCGITLPAQEAEEADEDHRIRTEVTEDEYYVSLQHPMAKEHFISFLLAVSDSGSQFVKLYPEGNAEAHFKIRGVKVLYAYCNRHGLYQYRIQSGRKTGNKGTDRVPRAGLRGL